MTESFSKNRSIGMSTKMSLHDDAREELVQSLGVSHEEANRMINKNTPDAQSAFERVYNQKQSSMPHKPIAKQSDWSIKNSGPDLRKQYASSEKAMNENMTESKSKMKFTNGSSVKQKVADETQALNKKVDANRGKINVEEEVLKQGVDKRAKDGTVVTVGKQIWNNAAELNPFSDEKE